MHELHTLDDSMFFFTEKADVGFAEIYDGECPDDKTKLMHICYCDTDGCNAKDNDDISG